MLLLYKYIATLKKVRRNIDHGIFVAHSYAYAQKVFLASTMYGSIISAAALPVVLAISSILLCVLLLFRCLVAAVKEEDTDDDSTTTSSSYSYSYPIANNDNRAPSPIISSAAIIKTEEIDTDNEDDNRVPIQVVSSAVVVKSEYQEASTDDEDDNRPPSPIISATKSKEQSIVNNKKIQTSLLSDRDSSPIICCWNEAHHLRIGFFGELINFIEYDIKEEEICKMLEETIKENPYLLEMTCPIDVLDNEREAYVGLNAVECCCRYPTYDSSTLYLLQKLIWLGAKTTYRCYLYIMNGPEDEVQLDYFAVLLQSGYFPLMIEYESNQVFTLDYIIELLPSTDIKEEPKILTLFIMLYKLVGLGDDFLFSEYQEERKTLVANNKQLPPLRTKGRRKTHSKNGPLDMLLKKYSVDDVWAEWESACNCCNYG